MQRQMVQALQSYKVLNLTKWAAMVAMANPKNFADYNRLITAGVAATVLTRSA